MSNKKILKSFLTLIITIFMLTSIFYVRTNSLLPKKMVLIQGNEYTYNFNTPLNVGVTVDKQNVIKLNGNKVNSNYKLDMKSPIKIQSNDVGKVNLKLKIFGKIPLRTVTVNIIPSTMVVPCGKTIGVKIYTKGVLVVGTSEITGIDGKEYKPYKESKIKEGDIILSINNKKIDRIADLSNEIIRSKGKVIQMDVERDNVIRRTEITPIKAFDDGNYKIGLWVRDSTSGIGTLTFYNPQTSEFAALGHGILDVDTSTLLTVNKGEILESSIVDVNKGKKGNPGELKGIFIEGEEATGSILENTKFGIYGKISSNINVPNNSPIPIAARNEVVEGPATILTNVSEKNIESYNIEIQKVLYNNYSDSKSMVIKITDSRLIEKTGGIVQGMSGSPIIQNGKLVGAVTHVFVSDSTRGYGIFTDLMLDSMNSMSKK